MSQITNFLFLDAIFSINRESLTDSLTPSLMDNVTISFFGHFSVVDRFGSSLQFCHLEFDKEAIYDDFIA